MTSFTDRTTLEAHVLHQEVVRESVRDERVLYEETREIKGLLTSLGRKINSLKELTARLTSRREQLKSRENIERHSKELDENRQQLRTATIYARKAIDESARISLLEGGSEENQDKARIIDEKSLKNDAAKSDCRCCYRKWDERVAHSEQTMDTLLHSSSVLAQTHAEFESHFGSNTTMEVDNEPVKMEVLLREYAELLRQSNDEGAKRMITRVEGILEATDDAGRSTPHFAAVGGCLPILKLSVLQDKMAADRPDMLGWTPLMIATSAGRVETVRYLLSLPEVNVNHRNENHQTALHYASSKNRKEITHLLLEAGAEVNAADRYGATPLHRAASQGHDGIVNMLLSQPKIHIDAKDSEGNTPLFLACEEGREDTAIALARKGADPLLKNKDEQCAFDAVQSSDLLLKVRNAVKQAQDT
ncbi:ankyrin repeat protein [Dictyocaulus viviparus]|uniref:Ankyrin repeat protein n=1 Tax=Dictyocaulus viviparus TaxID=29172 RepID=A0A0D8XTY9_DICVI|nr:ankyrin repeat protein [Dictyocaulus viviparus]